MPLRALTHASVHGKTHGVVKCSVRYSAQLTGGVIVTALKYKQQKLAIIGLESLESSVNPVGATINTRLLFDNVAS